MRNASGQIWLNGQLVPWGDARIHLTSETAMRGTNVFEGLRAYWQEPRSRFVVVALREHLERLASSARAIGLPADPLIEGIHRGIEAVITDMGLRSNLYIRASVYLDSGDPSAAPEQLTLGCFVWGRPIESRSSRSLTCAVSSWQHVPGNCLPSHAKIGATYTAFRLARQEAVAVGAEEAILLNANGEVTETPGAAIFLVNRGCIVTPSLSAGLLPSITRRIVIALLVDTLALEVEQRAVSHQELFGADELFVCGTLDEIRAVASVDQVTLPHAPGPVTQAVQKLYLGACHGHGAGDLWWLHPITMPWTTPFPTTEHV